METSVKLYSLKHSNVKTYLFALLFVAVTLHFHNYAILYLMVVLPCYLFIFSR